MLLYFSSSSGVIEGLTDFRALSKSDLPTISVELEPININKYNNIGLEPN